jgi:N-methylhydantoinase A
MDRIYESMFQRGREALKASGVSASKVHLQCSADMRYVGQEHPVTIDLPSDLLRKRDRQGIKTLFDEVHQVRYGTHAPAEPAEIVSLRAKVTGVMKKPPLEKTLKGGRLPTQTAHRGMRIAYFSELGRTVKTPTFSRSELRAGNQIEGPALIEEYASTTVVLPGDRLQVDEFGNLQLSIGRRKS